MVAAVQDAVSKGLTLEQAKKTIDLSKHSSSFPNFQQRSTAAMERTWAELTGQIKDWNGNSP